MMILVGGPKIPRGLLVWAYGMKSSKKPLGLKTTGNLGLAMAIGFDFGRITSVGPSTLSHSFPSLFEMAVDKFTIVVESWNHFDDRGGWNLNCVKAFNDWEVDLVVNLLYVLQKERVSMKLDSVTWKWAAGATFSMHNAYNLLAPSSGHLFVVKSILVPLIPSKVTFFPWEATWGKVLTLDKL